MATTTFGPVSKSIISGARFTAGRELVRDCGTGLTLGDAWMARREAIAAKRRGNYGARAYWLGIARELRTRRMPELDKAASDLGIELPSSRPSGELDAAHDAHGAARRIVAGVDHPRTGWVYASGALSAVPMTASERIRAARDKAPSLDAETCRHCGARSDWHDAYDGACPDDDCPHPYSVAADAASQAEVAHPFTR